MPVNNAVDNDGTRRKSRAGADPEPGGSARSCGVLDWRGESVFAEIEPCGRLARLTAEIALLDKHDRPKMTAVWLCAFHYDERDRIEETGFFLG